MQMQVETTVGSLRAPCNFSNRDVDDVPDGYFHFPHRDDVPEHITRLRIDEGVQVYFVSDEVILNMDIEKNVTEHLKIF